MADSTTTQKACGDADFTAAYQRLTPFIVDETYQQIELNLKSKGPGSGRGRPPSLPAVATITNRLLLQLGLLRHSLHTTWKTMEDVSLQILSVQFGKDLPHLFGLVDRALRNLPTNNDQLNTYLATVRDFSYPKDSPFCQKFGLTRGFLLGTENDLLMEMEQHTSVPCGLVMELCKFKSEHNLTLMKGNVVHTWLSHLCPSLDVSVRELTLKVAQLKKDYQKHMKAKSRRPTALADFLNSSFSCAPRFFSCSTQEAVVSVHDASSSTSSSSTLASNSSPPRKCSKHCKDSVIDAVHLKLQAKVKQQEDQLSQLHTEQTVLKEVCVGQQLTINTLHRSLTAVTEDLDSVATSLEASSTQLMEVKRDNATLKRNATNVQASKDAVLRHAAEHRQQQKELQRVQDQAAGLQKELASTKANLNKTSAAVTTLRQRLKQKDVLLREAEHKIADAEANHTELTIRNDNGHYKDSVKTCVIQLMGECDVSSAKVSHVMSTVVTNLLQKPVPPSEFPSKTTALRYADIGSALSRMQVLQALTANRFDLHVDGTSRDHKKMLGHQVTLQDNRQLSLGFTPVDKEDSTTLVEVTINLLAEIASVMNTSDEEKNKLMKEIFTNLTSTMTDRAATMKLFGKKLAEAKQDLLGDNDGLEFLFCTAHFLLGLSEAVDKGLSAVELENGWAKSLGRDTISAFTHFKASAKDPAACRLIRLACDVFGPRGDEKSGCRDEWLAHCAEVGKRSVFGSFRSNRFNNLFEGAAAVIHHREDIINFLSGKETLNLKLRSVKLDVEDQTICLMVTSMAALYVTVTGPFWRLINSEVHYLDLYIYVQSLEHHLQMIVDTPGAVRTMLESLPTCIDGFTIFQTPLVQTVRAECRRCSANEALKHTTQVLAMNFLTVIRRQLADFLLPDGQYSSPPSELMRERLAHCKMTNLFGEANFGDLDLSLYNRRHCSLHHHSSVNTLRRNKTVSWFQEQTSADQQRLMNLATLMGKGVREQNRTKEKEVLRQTQERLKQQRDELAQKQAAKEQRKRDIQQKVTAQGGACFSRSDVVKLMGACRNRTSKKAALTVQIQFHRQVLGVSSPLLVVSKNQLDEIEENFCKFLEQRDQNAHPCAVTQVDPPHALVAPESDLLLPTGLPHAPVPTEPPVDPPIASDSAEHLDHEMDQPHKRQRHQHFEHQGETIAVFYDNQFYVGEVLSVLEEGKKGEVTFMKRVRGKNIFVWPEVEDIDTVEKTYVFAWNLRIRSPNGRHWSIQNIEEVEELYKQMQDM